MCDASRRETLIASGRASARGLPRPRCILLAVTRRRRTWAINVQRRHAVAQRLRASDTVNFTHVILDTRPSPFSACNIEKWVWPGDEATCKQFTHTCTIYLGLAQARPIIHHTCTLIKDPLRKGHCMLDLSINLRTLLEVQKTTIAFFLRGEDNLAMNS